MKRAILLTLLFLFTVGLVVGFGAGFFYPHTQEITEPTAVHMFLPAVRANGSGILAKLTVLVKPGTGQILVNINDVLAGFETQNSARTAAKVASNFTGKSLDNVDVIYSIDANASSIDGPSAGAAMTMATIAALKAVQLNKSIIMTGAIRDDGSIGPASGLEGKIKAAEGAGLKLFLLPAGESVNNTFEKQTHCDDTGPMHYCTIDYKSDTRAFNITVKEVSNVGEAWRYFGE
ncbi:MAG: hypothetical protein J7L23_01140 [Candidatus Diapherotrites archaeon]|nr:hypothetical protein [Candidatus Diapherotrites archaeon]